MNSVFLEEELARFLWLSEDLFITGTWFVFDMRELTWKGFESHTRSAIAIATLTSSRERGAILTRWIEKMRLVHAVNNTLWLRQR